MGMPLTWTPRDGSKLDMGSLSSVPVVRSEALATAGVDRASVGFSRSRSDLGAAPRVQDHTPEKDIVNPENARYLPRGWPRGLGMLLTPRSGEELLQKRRFGRLGVLVRELLDAGDRFLELERFIRLQPIGKRAQWRSPGRIVGRVPILRSNALVPHDNLSAHCVDQLRESHRVLGRLVARRRVFDIEKLHGAVVGEQPDEGLLEQVGPGCVGGRPPGALAERERSVGERAVPVDPVPAGVLRHEEESKQHRVGLTTVQHICLVPQLHVVAFYVALVAPEVTWLCTFRAVVVPERVRLDRHTKNQPRGVVPYADICLLAVELRTDAEFQTGAVLPWRESCLGVVGPQASRNHHRELRTEVLRVVLFLTPVVAKGRRSLPTWRARGSALERILH